VGIRSLHSDLSTITGERVIIFSLDATPELVLLPGIAPQNPIA
jgi:uncharacterized protein YbcI